MRTILIAVTAVAVALIPTELSPADPAHASTVRAAATTSIASISLPRVPVREASVSLAPMRAVHFAQSAIGTPYVWGGESRRGYDCSGLVQAAWRHGGVRLPRVAADMYYHLRSHRVSARHLQPGDLLFFHHLGHVGIYVGHGWFIHAPHTGSHVKRERLKGWYRSELVGAVRVPWSKADAKKIVNAGTKVPLAARRS